MRKAITPIRFTVCLVTGYIINDLVISNLNINSMIDQVLCTTLIAIIFAYIAASGKVDVPE